MILFKDDWDNYPSAIVDHQTSNKTFLEFSSLLKKMGVGNSTFALSLMQPKLQGVDPYDPLLSKEYKTAILNECLYNPWYFIREVFRVPPIAGINPVPFIANRANISMIWSYLNHIDYLLIQPRQTGKSVSTDALMSWVYLFGARNAKMLLITKDDSLRSDNIARLKVMREYLPSWLVGDAKKDANNSTMVTYKTLNNIYRAAVGQNSEDGALKLGRGGTVPTMHIDEGPFIPFADIMIPAATSSMNAAKEEAEANGQPYGLVMTTTAGKIDSRSGRYFYNEIYSKCGVWTEEFYDRANLKDLRNVVRINSKQRIQKLPNGGETRGNVSICGVWSHRQLGKTDQWLYEKMEESRSTGDAADRDYLNRWTSGGLSSPFNNTTAAAILASERSFDYTSISKAGYILKWYKPQDTIKEYLAKTHLAIGVDTSDAIGQDGISVVLTDQQDLSVAAVANLNETNLIKAARWIAELLIEMPNTTLVIEKRSSAQTFIDTAITMLHAAGIDPLKRIYNRVVDERGNREATWKILRETPLAQRSDTFYDKFRKDFGFNTTGASRELLYSQVLMNAVKHSASLVCDKRLSEELRSLETRNGRIDHAVGGHDDTVIGWLLTHWFFMFARNTDFYGVDPRKMMLKVGKDGQAVTPEEAAEQERQERIREQIEDHIDVLKNTNDAYVLVVIETKLKRLMAELGDVEDALSVDGIVKEAREARQRKMRDRRGGAGYGRRAA